MLTMQKEIRETEQLNQASVPVETGIIQDVLCRLGRPEGLHRVQVKPVFGGKYRVNVYVRADSTSFKVAHSYFLEADGAGKILASTPLITRQY